MITPTPRFRHAQVETTAPLFCSPTFSVTFENHPSRHPWQDPVWRFAGVRFAPETGQNKDRAPKTSANAIRYGGFRVELHRSQCAAYEANLGAREPKLFVVCRWGPEGSPEPLLATVDGEEAAAYAEAGDPVFTCPLPPPLTLLVHRFLAEHSKPRPFRKRQRQDWRLDARGGDR